MDSASQFLLGAAIGEAVLGNKLGRRALLLGGLLGTLPDLDVLVRYADAVASFTYHRSWSHSLFMLSVASPVIAFLLKRYFPHPFVAPSIAQTADSEAASHISYARWLIAVWLILVTHPLLDGFTIYGTQLLWPLSVKPVAWGSIFIIDPVYTLPLLIGVLLATFWRHAFARKAVMLGLILSTLYLAFTLVSQQTARGVAITSLQSAGLSDENVLIAPFTFGLLWRIVSLDNDQYHEGYYSLLDKSKQVVFSSYDTGRDLINAHADHWPMARMDWFTQGFISARRNGRRLLINDLRIGLEASYVFRFDVGYFERDTFVPQQSQLLPLRINRQRAISVFERIRSEEIDLNP